MFRDEEANAPEGRRRQPEPLFDLAPDDDTRVITGDPIVDSSIVDGDTVHNRRARDRRRTNPHDSAAEDPTREPTSSRNGLGPAGRMLATIVIVAAVGGLSVGVLQWLRNDRDPVPPTPGWTSIIAVDRTSGDLTQLDTTGGTPAPTATANAGTRVNAVLDSAGRIAVVIPGRVVVDPFGSLPTSIDIPRDNAAVALPTGGSMNIVIGSEAGTDLTIAHLDANSTTWVRRLTDLTGETEPRYYPSGIRHDANGELIAIADATNFQTVLITPGNDDVVYLPDLALAVHPNMIVTSQTVGDRAEIAMFDPDGTRLRTLSTPAVRGATVTADGERVVIVTRTGEVLAGRPESSNIKTLNTVTLADGDTITDAITVAGGSRLVAVARHSIHLIATDGTELGVWRSDTTTGDTPTVDHDPLDIRSRCGVITVNGTSTMIDLADGDNIVDVTGIGGRTAGDDGCLLTGVDVAGTDNQAVLAGPSGRVGLGSGQVLALAPDASAVIINDGTTSRLFTVNDGDTTGGAPIDVMADLFTFVVDSTIDPDENDPDNNADTNTADGTGN